VTGCDVSIEAVHEPLLLRRASDEHLRQDDGEELTRDGGALLLGSTLSVGVARSFRGLGSRRGGALVRIADQLPDRLEFYENWLNPQGLRDGTIGLAPLNAVLSFLRTEGDAYEAVTRRAGRYAADWTVDELPTWHGRLLEVQ
jgi:hypothetical protein